MGYISDEIRNAAHKLNIFISTVDESTALKIRKKLAENFTSDGGNFPYRISWQNIANYESAHRPDDGWMLVGDFVGNEEVFLFISPDQEKTIWKIQSGTDLVLVLGECFGFPFCVTSENADYILCLDDHDCLIGSGRVVEWIQKLKNLPKTVKGHDF